MNCQPFKPRSVQTLFLLGLQDTTTAFRRWAKWIVFLLHFSPDRRQKRVLCGITIPDHTKPNPISLPSFPNFFFFFFLPIGGFTHRNGGPIQLFRKLFVVLDNMIKFGFTDLQSFVIAHMIKRPKSGKERERRVFIERKGGFYLRWPRGREWKDRPPKGSIGFAGRQGPNCIGERASVCTMVGPLSSTMSLLCSGQEGRHSVEVSRVVGPSFC